MIYEYDVPFPPPLEASQLNKVQEVHEKIPHTPKHLVAAMPYKVQILVVRLPLAAQQSFDVR